MYKNNYYTLLHATKNFVVRYILTNAGDYIFILINHPSVLFRLALYYYYYVITVYFNTTHVQLCSHICITIYVIHISISHYYNKKLLQY